MSAPAKSCVCGQDLPHHLAAFLSNHTCSCERRYEVRDGEFFLAGTCENPFARYPAVEGDEVAS